MKQINGYFQNAIDSVETFEILVMDFTIGETFLYDITQEETEETEQFLEDKKHHSSNCQWMIANKIRVNDLRLNDSIYYRLISKKENNTLNK